MNHPVKIESYYESKALYFHHITGYPENQERQLYVIEEYFECKKYNWPKMKLSLLERRPAEYGRSKEILFTWKRNYFYVPPMLYVKQNNQEFLVTSGDYQTLLVYNISRKFAEDYVIGGEDAYKAGRGFCPAILTMKDNNLIIEGSVFNGPPEKLIVMNPDFNNLDFEKVYWEDINWNEIAVDIN